MCIHQCLNHIAGVVLAHIPHKYSNSMAENSDTYFLDVLTKNEAKHADMVEIMQTMQGYLGEEFPHDQKVLSGDSLVRGRLVLSATWMVTYPETGFS